MRWAHLIVATAISGLGSVASNAQTCAFSAVNAFLKADAEKYKSTNPGEGVAEKAGLVSRPSKCPSMQEGGLLEFVDKVQIVKISGKTGAALIDTHQCGGGNKHGQYLVISQGMKCNIVEDPEIGDMRFIASIIYARDDGVVLKGIKWTKDDPHCCPSEQGTLSYRVSSGSYRFLLRELKQ